MSDAPSENAPAADTPASAAPSPPAASPPVAAGGGDTDTIGELPADQALFPRSYVEKLRTEAQKYRTEAQTAAQRAAGYDEVYGIYDEPDRKVWLDIARTWAVDPNRAAQVMNQIAQSVLDETKPDDGAGDKAAGITKEDVEEQIDAGLTPESVQQMIQDALMTREQVAAQEREVDNIYDQIRKAGIDPDTPDGLWVLATTNHVTNGDLDAAVAAFRQRDQKIIDDYLAGRAAGTHPIPAPNGGVAANQTSEITTFDEARKATDAFLRGQGAAGP